MRLTTLPLVLALGASLAWYLAVLVMVCTPLALNSPPVRSSILNAVSRSLGDTVAIADFEVSARPWPQLEVSELDLGLGPVQALIPKLSVTPRVLPMLWGEFSLDSIHLYSPRLTFREMPHEPSGPSATNRPEAFLSKLPDSVEIRIHDGRAELIRLDARRINLDNLQALIELGQAVRFTGTCSSTLWRELSLNMQTDLRSLATSGRFSIQGLRPDVTAGHLPVSPPWTWEGAGIDLDGSFVFEDRDHARFDLHASASELALSRKDSSLALSGLETAFRADLTPQEILLQVDRLKLSDPQTKLSGQLSFDRETRQATVIGNSARLDVTGVRQRCLALFPKVKPVREVLNILRGGRVFNLKMSSSGSSLKAIWKNLNLETRFEDGRVFVPGPDLDLTRVKGDVALKSGVLTGSAFSASLNQARAWNGTMTMGLNEHIRPFILKAEIQGNAGQIPIILEKTVKSRPFLRELDRVSDVQGTFTGTLGLNRDSQHPMQVTVQARDLNLRAAYEPLPFPVQVSEGTFEYTDAAISGQDIQLTFGHSTIKELIFELALQPSLELEYEVRSADLKWEQLYPWLAGSDFCRTSLPGLKSVNGTVSLGSMSFSGPPGDLAGCSYQARGILKNIVLDQKGLPGPVRLESGTFALNNTKVNLSECRFRFLDGHGVVNGWVARSQGRPPDLDLTYEGTLGTRALGWLAAEAGMPQVLKIQPPLEVNRSRIIRTPKAFHCDLQGLVNSSVQLDLDLSWSPGQLELSNLEIRDRISQANLRATSTEDLWEVSFAGSLDHDTLDRLLEDNRLGQASFQGNFAAGFRPGKLQIQSASGRASISNLLIPVPGLETFRAVRLGLEAEGGVLSLEQGLLELEKDIVELEGAVDFRQPLNRLDLHVGSRRLHWQSLNRLLSRFDTLNGDKAEGRRQSPGLTGQIQLRADCFYFHGLSWCPLQADVHLTPDRHVRISMSDSRLCTIDTRGSLVFKPRSCEATAYPSARKRDLNEALRCLFKKQELMTGRFDLSGQLSAQGGLSIERWQGELDFLSREGRIKRFNLLGKILGFLNSTEILFGNFPDIEEQGMGYNELAIRSRVDNGLLILKEGRLDGESVEIGFQGQVNLVSREVNLNVLVAPLKTVDRLVKKIPVLSGLMGGNLISIPVKVSGPLNDPSVRPMSPEAVSNELKNVMKRALKLPMKIISPFLPDKD